MIKRTGNYLTVKRADDTTPFAEHLEREGYVVVQNALTEAEVAALREQVLDVFAARSADDRSPHRSAEDDEMFRYEMFNRSPASLRCLTHPKILEVIEPLLGNDCHVIANTAWHNPAGQNHEGGFNWHVDGGPHVPLAEGMQWPEDIPHPVFAIGVHVFLEDSGLDDGPTGVIPRSHLSGRFPPWDQVMNDDLQFNGQGCAPLLAKAGDIAFFVSDLWHRRMPTTEKDSGRLFLQIHYGRRDIAQRVKPTAQVNHVDPDVLAALGDERTRKMVGLHSPGFYDG
jgi:ectoine hydroxylase-related dioxygenase (phytanoyl-CoA dioxygenase family)